MQIQWLIREPSIGLFCPISHSQNSEKLESENLFEDIIDENFPNVGKETDPEAGAQRTPNIFNRSRSTPSHIVIKMQNVVIKKNFHSKKTNVDSYLQGKPHKVITGCISEETLKP